MANYTYKEIIAHFKSIKEEIVAYREVFLKNVETFSELKHREEGHYDQATYDKVDYDIQLTVAILMYITTGKVPSKFKEMWSMEVFLKVLVNDLGEHSKELKKLIEFVEALND